MKEYSVSIVIPVYNEDEAIENVLINIKNYLDKIEYINYEIICVDDCSKDNSLSILNKIDFIKVVSHTINQGYGAALKSGITNASNDLILIMDSDGQHKVEDIPMLLKPIGEGYKMSVGSRKITNTKKRRVIGKYVIHKLANYLLKYDVPDINSGFRLFYKSEAKQYFHLCSNRFSFTTSITLAYLQDYKSIKYTPIEVLNRTTGQSQVNMKAGLRAILKIIQVVMVFNPLRVLLPFAFLFFFLGSISLVLDVINGNLTESTLLLGISTILVFIFSLISDQLSTIRKEIWNRK